jgi:methylmalonyl-CoA mutase
MNLKKMIDYSFPKQSVDNWRQKAEASLKGKNLDSLARNTFENIQLKPLYTKEDLDGKTISQFPGNDDFRRGSSLFGEPWKIAQRIEGDHLEEFKTHLTSFFQKGQTAISFNPTPIILKEIPHLLISYYESFPFSVNGGNHQRGILECLIRMPKSHLITGFVGKDPIALYAKGRDEYKNLDSIYDRWFETIQMTSEKCPMLKTLLVDTTPYHNSGANAVQELAIALSTAVYDIEQLRNRGMKVNEIIDKMVFHFSIGSNFFMEVAKLRAARVLWKKVLEAYEVMGEEAKLVISAETSWFTKTAYDPYVNILRAGNEAFAAVLGGVQFLHVSPYNQLEGLTSEVSERIARNTQIILKEEARLGAVMDPAGGSWYIETITNQLVERAWSLFLEMDEKGGLLAVIKNGWLQSQLNEVKVKRQTDVLAHKQIIVGTNEYADLKENPLPIKYRDQSQGLRTEREFLFEERLAEPYEKLRKKREVEKGHE